MAAERSPVGAPGPGSSPVGAPGARPSPAVDASSWPGTRGRDRLATTIRTAAQLYAMGPLAIAVFVTLAGRLTANPVEDLTRRMGQDALLMLTLSLAVNPLVWLVQAEGRSGSGSVSGIASVEGAADAPTVGSGRPPGLGPRLGAALRPLRRVFGLWAFAYACLHLFMFAVVDYGLVPARLAEAVFEKRYALVGFVAFVLLSLLAGASTAGRRRRIGAAWARLQRLVYPAALLVVLHMLWAAKVVTPARVAWAVAVVALLALRVPPWLSSRRLVGRRPRGGSAGVSGPDPAGRAG